MAIHYGYIFDPQNPQNIIESVALNFEEGDFYLEIPRRLAEHKTSNILSGVFNKLGNVSFINARITNSTEGAGSEVTKIKPDYLISNYHANSSEELYFNEITMVTQNLLDWMKVSSFEISRVGTNKSYKIKEIEPITHQISQELSLSINFISRTKFTANPSEIKLSTSASFSITTLNHALSLGELITHANDFRRLISILTLRFLSIDKVSLVNDSTIQEMDNGKFVNDPASLFSNKLIKGQSLSFLCYSLKFNEIESQLQHLVQNWYSNSQLRRISELILEKVFYPALNRENQFLNSCFAIETFHREFHNHTIFGKSEFAELKKAILESIEHKKIQDWFSSKNSHTNEPNFRERLYHFMKDLEKVIPDDLEVEIFIRNVVKTRNGLVHKSEHKHQIKGIDLYYYAMYLDVVTRANIFRQLKLTEELIDIFLTKSKDELHGFHHANRTRAVRRIDFPSI